LAEVEPTVGKVDRVLVDVTRMLRLFYHLAPTNEADERTHFLDRDGGVEQPAFEYRALDFSASDARRDLENAPVDAIEDSALRGLYEEKMWELGRLVGLLEARGKADFLERSIELFGRPPPEMVGEARELLTRTTWEEERNLDAEEVRAMLGSHVDTYHRRYGQFDCEIVVDEDMSAKMYVDENRIHVKRGAVFSRAAALCDTVHEIDAHVLTFLNGSRQPYALFRIGLRGTLAYQESLGVFTEIANGVMFPGRSIALVSRVVAVAAMVDGASFPEVFTELTNTYGLDPGEAWLICVRAFRGGGLTKDWLYVAELEHIFRHWGSGGNMETLLLAKVTVGALDEIEDLVARGLLLPATYLPTYLERISGNRPSDAVQQLLAGPHIALQDLLAVKLG
jgi:uncharacterized protein (TIGR02421 family)